MKDEFVILHIDKQPENTSVFEKRFQRKYSILKTSSGADALNVLEGQTVHLIVVGDEMPDMLVGDFLRKVKENYPEVKTILIIDSDNAESTKKIADEIGIYWHFNKPVDMDQMGQVLENGLDTFRIDNKRKFADKALGKIVKSSKDAIITINDRHRIVMANPAATSMFGYKHGELIGLPLNELIPIDHKHHEQLVNQFGKARETTKYMSPEKKAFGRAKNGELVPIESAISKIVVDGVVYYNAIVRDLTAKFKIEEKLLQYEKNFSVSMDLLCIANTKGYFLEVNPQFGRLLGYTDQELLETQFIDFVHSDDVGATLAEVNKLAKGKETTNFVNRYRTKDGRYVWLSWTCKPEVETGLLYASARDISKQQMAERDLAASNRTVEEQSRQLKEAQSLANLGSWEWDVPNNVIKLSEEACRIYGVDNDAYLQTYQGWLKTIHTDDVERVQDKVTSLYKNHKKVEFKYRIHRPNGEERILQSWNTLEIDSVGNPSKMIGATLDVTNLEKTENKLHDVEGQFQSLFELSPDAVFIHNFETITHVNKAFLNLFGYERKEDIIGKPALKTVVFHDDYQLVKAARQKFKLEDTVFLPKIRHIKQDGSVFKTETHISQVTIDGVPHLQIISRDITDREKLEKRLKRSEEKFRGIFESMVDIFVRVSNDGIVEMISPSAETLGYSPSDVLEKPVLNFYVNQDDRAAYIKRIVETGSYNHFETQIYTKSGSIMDISSNGRLYKDRNGKWGIESVFRDITAYKQQQKQLANSELKLRKFFDMAPVGIAINNMKGEFIEVNNEFARFTGYTAKELNKLSYWELTPEKYALQEQEQLDSMAKRDAYGPYEKEYIHKKNHLYPVLLNGIKITDQNGDEFIWSVVQDISQAKRAENELVKGKKVIEEQSERLEEAQRLAHLGSWEWDLENDNVLWSDELYRIFGINDHKKKQTLRSFLKYVHADDKSRVLEMIQDVLNNKAKADFGFRIIDHFGKEHNLQSWSSMKLDDNGEPVKMVGAVIDISELTEKKKALHESEQRLASINENSPDLITTVNRNMEVTYVNRLLEGYSEEDLVGQSILNFIPDQDRDLAQEFLLKALEGERQEFEMDGFGENGEIVRYAARVSPFTGTDKVETLLITSTDITWRKHAEKEMAQQLQRIQQLLSTTIDGYILLNQTGEILDVNKAYIKMIGRSNRDIVGRNIAEIDAKLSLDAIEQLIVEIKQGGKRRFETIHRHKTKRLIDLDVSITIVGETDNNFSMVAFVRDITERKRVEKALKQSEEQFRDIVQSTNDLIQSVDGEGNLTFVNKSWLNTLGYSQEDVIGKPVFNFIHPSDKGHCEALFREISMNKIPTVSDEIHFIGKSGKEIITEADINSTFKNDKLKLTRGVFRDITERKLSREMLDALSGVQTKFIQEDNAKKSFNALLDVLLEVTSSEYGFIGEVLLDDDKNPYLKTYAITDISWNEETSAFYKEKAPKGLEFRNLHTLFGRVLTTGEPVISNDPYNDPRRGGLPKGHPHMGSFLGLPFYNNNKMIGMVGIANRPEGYDDEIIKRLEPILATGSTLILANQNVVKRQRAEKELRRLNENLEDRVQTRTLELENARQELAESLEKEKELNELKSRFVSMASHQFRTPLTVIQSSVNIMEMQTEEMGSNFKPGFIKAKNRINEQIERMTVLMNDVLVLGKVNAKSIKYRPESISLEDACSGIVKRFNGIQKDGRKITMSTVGTPRNVFIDPSLFDHSISNIVSNALKYSANKKSPEIIIHFREQDTQIDIIDYGVGIPEEELNQLYEPFHRASNTKDVPGTGLGMSIAKEYIELNKGTIAVESKVGKGTKISVFFKELTPAIK